MRVGSFLGGGGVGRAMVREKLSADRTYYVRPDGNDANDGLTNNAAGAFLTIQKAIDAAYALDFGGKTITVQLADGTYTGGAYLAGAPDGMARNATGAPIIIRGNAATPANVIISTTSADCVRAQHGAIVEVRDVELRTTMSGNCLNATAGSTIYYRNIRFGACAGMHKQGFENSRMYNGSNEAGGQDYAIVGGATAHEHFTTGSISTNLNATVTLSGTPAFSAYFIGCSFAYCNWWTGMTITGAATGPRYTVLRNGAIRVPPGAGENFFPGDSAGVSAAGGKYLRDNVNAGDERYTVKQSGLKVDNTGNTGENTLATITIPGKSLGPNGRAIVTSLWKHPNNGNNKTIRTRFNGTAFASAVLTTSATTRMVAEIQNANAENSQVGGPANFPDSFGFTTAAEVTSAHDTTGNLNITLTAQCGVGTDTISLLGYSVEIIYGK